MKQLQGYLIDRETGAGISGKTVSFKNLAGAAITTATTYAQAVDSVTDANGKFDAWFELSPGPVNIQVDVSGTEVKVRKHDEKAQFGAVWSSDIQRLGRALPNGVVDGFLNELAVSTPSLHNIVIATGAAIIRGHVFSIENGPMTIVGTANSNPAINPRLDLVTLRQHHEEASGQDSGRQEVVVTLGSTSDVAPALPTGGTFTDIPLAVVSTAYNATSKTLHTDRRLIPGDQTPKFAKSVSESIFGALSTSYQTVATVTVTGLNPDEIYDGQAYGRFEYEYSNEAVGDDIDIEADLDNAFTAGGAFSGLEVLTVQGTSADPTGVGSFEYEWPLLGVTGVSSLTFNFKLREESNLSDFSIFGHHAWVLLSPRR